MAIVKSRINLLSKTPGQSNNYYCISPIVLGCMDEVTTEPHSTSTIASKELHVVSFHYTEDNRHWSLLGRKLVSATSVLMALTQVYHSLFCFTVMHFAAKFVDFRVLVPVKMSPNNDQCRLSSV
jgi:hypothetical protein